MQCVSCATQGRRTFCRTSSRHPAVWVSPASTHATSPSRLPCTKPGSGSPTPGYDLTHAFSSNAHVVCTRPSNRLGRRHYVFGLSVRLCVRAEAFAGRPACRPLLACSIVLVCFGFPLALTISQFSRSRQDTITYCVVSRAWRSCSRRVCAST